MLRRTLCAGLRWLIISCVLGLVGTGCDSVYYRAQAGFSAQPADQLKMRLQEAHQAEQRAAQAAAILRDRVASGGNGDRIKTDVDRLEMRALDLRRCVAAAKDGAALSEHPQQFTTEIQRLQERASQFLKMTLAIRDSGPSPATQQLDELAHVLDPR